MEIMRYYAQHTVLTNLFQSRHQTGWQVFDRNLASPQGDTLPIAFCVNRHAAFTIRDALNQYEERRLVQPLATAKALQ